MILRSLKEIKNLKGKKVILRINCDVTLDNTRKLQKGEDARIIMSLPTIQYLIRKKAIVIIITHMGRPKGKRDEKFSLDLIAERLSVLLKKKIKKINAITGHLVETAIKNAKEGDIIMLENARFYPEEEKNDASFAHKLARFGDIYVNEAFSNSHRKHASMVAITSYLPSYAGLLLEKEVSMLSNVVAKAKKPIAVILGGAKISTKLGLITIFEKTADYILLGGAIANTALEASGISIGLSLTEHRMIPMIKKIIIKSKKIYLPIDCICAEKISKNAKFRVCKIQDVKPSEYILDIGPQTAQEYSLILKKSKTIIWNGPLGMIEYKNFSKGTRKVFQTVVRSQSRIIIGGGDTLKGISNFKSSAKKNIFLSSGGGAMLQFLENENLPALFPLKK